MLIALAAGSACAEGWAPEFADRLTNAVPDRRLLSNQLWAVNERCEATYLGSEVVTNGPAVMTNRVYGVAPITFTQTVIRWDYTNLVVCGLITQTWSGGSAVLTNLCPVATTNRLTNEIAYATLDLLREIATAALALPPYYLDTSLCPSGDCSGYFATPVGSNYPVTAPRWTAVSYLQHLGVGTIVTTYPGGLTVAALTVMPPRTTAVVLAEAFAVPAWLVISSSVESVTGRYEYAGPARYDGPMVLSSCASAAERWWQIAATGAACDVFSADWWGGNNFGPHLAGPYVKSDNTATANVSSYATNEMRLDWLDRSAFPPRSITATSTPIVRVTVTTGACPAVSLRIEGTRIAWDTGYMGTTTAVETVTVPASTSTVSTAPCVRQWSDITNIVVAGVYDARMDSLVVQYDAEIGYYGELSGEPLYGVLWELYRIIDGLRFTVPPVRDFPTRQQTVGWIERNTGGYGLSDTLATGTYVEWANAQTGRVIRFDTPVNWGAATSGVLRSVGGGAEAMAGRVEEYGETPGDTVMYGLADWSEARRSLLTPYVLLGTGAVEAVDWWVQGALVDESECSTTAPPRIVVLQQSSASVQIIGQTGSYYVAQGRASVGSEWDPYGGIASATLDGCPTNLTFDLRYDGESGLIPGMSRPDLYPEYAVWGIYTYRRVTGEGFEPPAPVVRWDFRYQD